MTSRIHSLLPRIALVLALPVLGLLIFAYLRFTRPFEVAAGSDIFDVIEGRWAWTTDSGGCANKWHDITFNKDRRVMTITSSQPYEGADGELDSVAVYDVLASTPGWIRGAIRGETRLTAAGTPVVWDLVLRGPDRYVWHRTDWVRGGFTREIERCD